MLSTLRDFFERHIAPVPGRDERHSIELATAARSASRISLSMRRVSTSSAAVLAAVRDKFGLSPAEADMLVALAEEEVRLANDYFQFTSLINRHFSAEQKVRVIELMWRVAWADDDLSAHERHLMRKIADLLHVPLGDYVAAQARARGGRR